MKLIDIIAFLIIFNFVITGLSSLSLLTGPTYVEPESQYDVSDYEASGATELIWTHISRNFLLSLGAGIVAGILANKLMGIPGNMVLAISIFTGLISHGLIGTSNLLWNIYYSLSPTFKPAMGIGLYMFFSIIGLLLAITMIQMLSYKGVISSQD